MLASVIISTYNSPEWLKKVLIGYSVQTYKDFEVIIADDGSDNSTKVIIEEFKNIFTSLIHVWHEDNGFRKCEILNKAIVASSSPYLIFTDGDCIPRKDFVETHITNRKRKHFLSGGYFKLPLSISQDITPYDIQTQNCFDLKWLRKKKLPYSFKNQKLSTYKGFLRILNALTTTKPTWNGHNASGWKEDILAINGFDERMKYGGEDREMGERLLNNSILPIQIRYKAICIHLDHARGYVNKRDWELNNAIRRQTKKNKSIWTIHGIDKV
ncbi:glycosyltransferase family 2 protein [Sphingobacterium spiritivorum]